MSPQGELALLARVLHRAGYDDQLAGHITYRQSDETLLVNPFGLTWDEVTASDIMRIDMEGRVLDGPWTVTPAISLHLELHAARADVVVAVHNHPRWATLWADMGEVPPIFDQTGGLVSGDIAIHTEYGGTVDARSTAADAVRAMGSAKMALLTNHGVLVVGDSIASAHHRCSTLEWRSRQAWHLAAVSAGIPMPAAVVDGLDTYFDQGGFAPLWWEAMARRELRADRSILT